MNDHELLQKFCRNGSQEAFEELLKRHVNLVYSATRRMLSDDQLAEDVTQQVFLLLARKAHKLSAKTIVSGWLYRTARNIASETIRRETRRAQREQIAAEQMSAAPSGERWKEIEALLDSAMAGLSRWDHDAVVLRYFENRSYKEVGKALHTNEDAAQKRVTRALSRLRARLTRSGAVVSESALAVTLVAEAVKVAPATAVASALSSLTVLTANFSDTVPLVSPMATRLKMCATGAVVGALSLALIILCRQNSSLKQEIGGLRASIAETAQSLASSTNQSGASDELKRLRLEHLELIRLRGRVAQLANELWQRGNSSSVTNLTTENGDSVLFTAALTNRVGNGYTLIVGGWASVGGWDRAGMRGYILTTPSIETNEGARDIALKSQVIGAPEEFWSQIGWGTFKSDTRRSTVAAYLAPDDVNILLQALEETTNAEISNISSTTNREGERVDVGFTVDDGQGPPGALMAVRCYPWIAPDAQAVDLQLSPCPVAAKDVHPSLK